MICYIDSSIILRKILNQSNSFKKFHKITTSYSSRLLEVECHRTFDRFRLNNLINDKELSLAKKELYAFLDQINIVEINTQILTRACQSFPTQLGTLDAIHLSSALLTKEFIKKDLVFLTNDDELSTACVSLGFTVDG